MQVRLKVQRAHAAIVDALPYWEEHLQSAKDEHEHYIAKLIAQRVKQRTWCGGYKYNAGDAEKVVKDHIDKFPFYIETRSRVEITENILKRMRHLADQTDNKSGFMVWFDEKDYIKFSESLNWM